MLVLCRFGTEHEKLGYNLADNTRIGYDKIRTLLEGLCDRFGWEPVMEGEYIIGAELDGQNVSLEPGGQFELSGAPLDTLHKTCAEVANHLYQVLHHLPLKCSLPTKPLNLLRQNAPPSSCWNNVQVKTIAAEIGVGFLTLGFDPKTHLEDVPIMPKERYRQAKTVLLSLPSRRSN
jgi:glutamate--cysteine ligase